MPVDTTSSVGAAAGILAYAHAVYFLSPLGPLLVVFSVLLLLCSSPLLLSGLVLVALAHVGCFSVCVLFSLVHCVIVGSVDFGLEFAAMAASVADSASEPASSACATICGDSSNALPINRDAQSAVLLPTISPTAVEPLPVPVSALSTPAAYSVAARDPSPSTLHIRCTLQLKSGPRPRR